jgi:hypothetical protein
LFVDGQLLSTRVGEVAGFRREDVGDLRWQWLGRAKGDGERVNSSVQTILASVASFSDWLRTERLIERTHPDDMSLSSLDQIALFLLFTRVEALVGEAFSTELTEVIATVDDLFYFASVKASH